MSLDYDPVADSAYLRLCDPAPGTTRHRRVEIDPWLIDGLVTLDLDAAGRIIGVEFCGASLLLRPELLPDPDSSRPGAG